MSGEAVKVIVRCRPLNKREKDLKCGNVIEMDDKIGQCRLQKPGEKGQPPKAFTFDGVFNVDSITESIYADICFPLVEGIVEGYNGTVFAYGQTGCGKSFTMQGVETPAMQRGIIPRAFEHVFESIHVSDSTKYLVNASYLEIYNEDIRDLLVKDQQGNKLEVKEHPDKGVYVKSLSMNRCHNVKDMEVLMDRGGQNRSVGATLMNADSSRSHSIFTIYVETCESSADGSEHIRAGKLNLVDLAGSERQAKTGATGNRLKEATKINLSLSALGNVISALVDGKSKHIPYRDSKLTRLLQDSLGGNTKTLMVACISPADNNYDETLSTLRYANRAKNITNKPKINEDPKDALLREYQDEINLLKQLLTGQIQLSPDITAKLGLNGLVLSPYTQSIAEKVPNEGHDQIKRGYDKELEIVQIKNEEEHFDKRKLEEEVLKLQNKLSVNINEPLVDSEIHDFKIGETALEFVTDNFCEVLSNQPPFVEHEIAASPNLNLQGNEDSNIKDEAVKRLSSLQQHLVKSEPQIDKEELKKKHEIRKKHYKERRQNMLKEVEKWEGEGVIVQVYDNLQDEIKGKQNKISHLETEIVVANAEIKDLQEEFQSERNDYLDTIRKLQKQLMLHHQILDRIQPTIRRDCNYFYLEKVKSQSEFNEESQSWKIPDLTIERVTLPKAVDKSNRSVVSEVKSHEDIDKYALHIQHGSYEDFSNSYFKPTRIEKLLSNSSPTVSSSLSENSSNLCKMADAKSPLPDFTRRPLKLEALPQSAFDKKKKKSKNK